MNHLQGRGDTAGDRRTSRALDDTSNLSQIVAGAAWDGWCGMEDKYLRVNNSRADELAEEQVSHN